MIHETARTEASWVAVMAHPKFSIRSARATGCSWRLISDAFLLSRRSSPGLVGKVNRLPYEASPDSCYATFFISTVRDLRTLH
jgi:hypothetical protein